MKAKELTCCLLEYPDWDVWFNVVDVGSRTKYKTIILVGEESEKRTD